MVVARGVNVFGDSVKGEMVLVNPGPTPLSPSDNPFQDRMMMMIFSTQKEDKPKQVQKLVLTLSQSFTMMTICQLKKRGPICRGPICRQKIVRGPIFYQKKFRGPICRNKIFRTTDQPKKTRQKKHKPK